MTADDTRSRPTVSIIIPAFNKWAYTYNCLLSLLRNTAGVSYETIVIDNASSDETALALPQLEGLRIHRNETNVGFSKACNQGARMARGRHLLFLNNDTEALPGWLLPLTAILDAEPTVGAVGAKLLFPDGTIQHGGVAVAYAAPLPVSPFHIHYRRAAETSNRILELSAVTAACVLIRREVFEEVGGFDEAYRNGYEDVDLCFKIRERGHRILFTPHSVLYHHESVSDGRFHHTAENEDLLNRRWMGRFTAFDVDRRKTKAAIAPTPRRPPISVVVPTLDALQTIAACLEDIALEIGPSDEIIVAERGSRDCTLAFVEMFARDHPARARIVREEPAGSTGALGAALATARGKISIIYFASHPVPSQFCNVMTAQLARAGHAGIVTLGNGTGLFAIAGRTASLQRLWSKAASALLDPAPTTLARAATAHGLAYVHLVPSAQRLRSAAGGSGR